MAWNNRSMLAFGKTLRDFLSAFDLLERVKLEADSSKSEDGYAGLWSQHTIELRGLCGHMAA